MVFSKTMETTQGKAASSGYIFPKIIPEAQSDQKRAYIVGFERSSEEMGVWRGSNKEMA